MDSTLAIIVNRKALLRVIVEMIAMLGGVSVETVTRRVHLAVLERLQPAESAARRLIAALAHGISVTMRAKRAMPSGGIAGKGGTGVPCFALFDPRKRIGPVKKHPPGRGPGVWSFDDPCERMPDRPAPSPDDSVDAARLCARIQALRAALKDLPRQARRLARAMARKTFPKRAMRPGRPPGHRTKWRHPVDELLAECQEFALLVLAGLIAAPSIKPP